MADTLTLKKRMALTDDGRVRLQVWVHDLTGSLRPEIFLVRHCGVIPGVLPNPYTTHIRVCSYSDMVNYPANAPDTERRHYRRAWFDGVYDSFANAQAEWADIQADVQVLLDDTAAVNQATPATSTESV